MEWGKIFNQEVAAAATPSANEVATEIDPLASSSIGNLRDLVEIDPNSELFKTIEARVLKGDETLYIDEQEFRADLHKHPEATVAVFRANNIGEVHYQDVYASREEFIDRATFASTDNFLDEGSAKFKVDALNVDESGYRFVPLTDILER